MRLNLNRVSKENHLHVKGVLAIQLYAATKREDTGEISSSNYRERLCQILNLDIYQELKPWMETNQDNFWAAFYSWCRKNDFQIVEYRPSPGPWRYVQYPVQQASRVFTQKDLKLSLIISSNIIYNQERILVNTISGRFFGKVASKLCLYQSSWSPTCRESRLST